MPGYRDLDNDSGVASYEVGPSWIDVQFKGGSIYRYSAHSVGQANLERMIALAHAGEGLNSFIQRRVKKSFETKLR